MGAGGCLVRLGWMFLGSAILLYSAVGIIRHEGEFLSVADAVFWAALVGCIVLRYVDIKYLHGHTAAGDPATMTHWRRYVLTLLGVGAAVWGVAHGISHFYR
jgi:hypothetical protein